ncbi:glycoside hydrolase family 11 protein [Collybiopsis luxurians FD-317 M1]|uniref:Endo-1,4-beta-xylanase n=1 Tax=Collybiopsis luxurians FD-317 M1 TaxID=944289 RepID=A0A0D0CCP0_9AGAR|nr:glycoside hydrolase family 11 protein [Collybiopsis luxurians FD-317 M1]
MVFISLATLALAVVTSVYASPVELFDNSTVALGKRSLSDGGIPGEGTSNGFFYSVFSDSTVTGTYTNGAAGEYSVTWGGSGDLVVGKGWNPGSARAVTYSGTWQPNGNSYLSVYGWTTNPLIEYYIMESFGTFNPSTGATFHGTCTSDGSTYNIYSDQRVNAPSIQGTQTFTQYLSIRNSHRVGGTVTTANHFNCFAELGLPMGTFNYMIVATEAFSSTGTATITVQP